MAVLIDLVKYQISAHGEDECRVVQLLLFKLGYTWHSGDRIPLYIGEFVENNFVPEKETFGRSSGVLESRKLLNVAEFKEIALSALLKQKS